MVVGPTQCELKWDWWAKNSLIFTILRSLEAPYSESTGRGKKSLEVLIDTETEASLQRDLYQSASYIFYSQKGLGLNNAPLTTSLVLSSGPRFYRVHQYLPNSPTCLSVVILPSVDNTTQ